MYDCRTLVIPMLLLMAALPFIYIRYGYNTAYFISDFGALLVCAANIIYIIFWHTSDVKLPWQEKLRRLLTFKKMK
jgi:hypothetical protein